MPCSGVASKRNILKRNISRNQYSATFSPKTIIKMIVSGFFANTVEIRIKESTFIRTLRLKFNILNPLNKNISEAKTGRGSYITGFMSSEFTRTLKNT